MNWGVTVFGYTSPADPASLPLFVLVMGLFGLITMPLGNAYSRWRESKADAYALQATHNPQAFIGAMTRLANQNLGEDRSRAVGRILATLASCAGQAHRNGESVQGWKS